MDNDDKQRGFEISREGLLWRNRAEVRALGREGRSVKRAIIDAHTKRVYDEEEAARLDRESR